MNTKTCTAIHKRGLVVLAIASAFLQLAAAPADARRLDRHDDLRDYQATYRPSRGQGGMAPAWHDLNCADVVDAASGARGCSTGGPAGGLPDRN